MQTVSSDVALLSEKHEGGRVRELPGTWMMYKMVALVVNGHSEAWQTRVVSHSCHDDAE